MKAWAWLGLLLAESEFLAVGNYELRTEIRALLGLPLYHLSFSFLAFALFLQRLLRTRAELDPLSGRWMGSHLLVFATLALHLQTLQQTLAGHSPLLKALAWLVLGLLFSGTWLAAVLRPGRWVGWLRRHAAWLGASLALAALSLGILHVSNWLWRPLASGTLKLSHGLLACIYDDVSSRPETYQIGTTTFHIVIEPGCSGYEGIGLVTMFTLTYLWLRRRELRFPLALGLLPAGCLINWLVNGLRIATLVVIGTNFSPDLAMKGFHSQAGWLTFVLTSSLLVIWVEEGHWFHRLGPAEAEPAHYPAAPYLLPLLALLLGTMLGQAFSGDFAWLYPLRILLATAALARLNGAINWGRWFTGRALNCGLLVYLIWCLLVPAQAGPTVWQHLPTGWAWLWLGFRVVGSSLVVPLVEELAFRGYLMRRLQTEDFENLSGRAVRGPAWVLSALLFGALHQDFLAATLAGLAYGSILRRGGSLGEAVTAHAVTNACISLQVLWLGHWSLWG